MDTRSKGWVFLFTLHTSELRPWWKNYRNSFFAGNDALRSPTEGVLQCLIICFTNACGELHLPCFSISTYLSLGTQPNTWICKAASAGMQVWDNWKRAVNTMDTTKHEESDFELPAKLASLTRTSSLRQKRQAWIHPKGTCAGAASCMQDGQIHKGML